MLMMNVMRLQVPSWQRGPLYSRKWSIGPRVEGIPKGPSMWVHNILTVYSGRVGWLGYSISEKARGTLGSMVLTTLGHRGWQYHMYWGWKRTAGIYNHSPSLRQRLQNARWLMQWVPNQTHTLMEWINAAIHTIWSNAGELLDTVSKWHMYAQLTQVMRELGMKQSIFNTNTRGSCDEHFTGGIQEAILNSAPSTTFGSMTTILAPYMGCPIYEVASMVASLGEIKGWGQAKGIRSVKTLKGAWAGKDFILVTITQMWADLLAVGVDQNKIDRQPNALLLELWRQLRPEKQFYQVWEAPTARDTGGSVRKLHDAQGCSFQWCPFPLWIGLRPRCPSEEPKQGPEAPYRTCNSLVTR